MRLPWLLPERVDFPDPEHALDEPNGLLAAGGDLTPEWLLEAYRRGIFPWFEDDQLILWWSPDPRAVIRPDEVRIHRSLRKRLRNTPYQVTFDTDFAAVVRACAAPRIGASGTWITERMINAYCALHVQGHAHSIEVWMDDRLAGGLYGVALGRCFFGESMFTHVTDASKIAFVHLLGQLGDWGFPLIDCQLPNAHLTSLGVRTMPRDDFLREIRQHVAAPPVPFPWRMTWQPRDSG